MYIRLMYVTLRSTCFVRTTEGQQMEELISQARNGDPDAFTVTDGEPDAEYV